MAWKWLDSKMQSFDKFVQSFYKKNQKQINFGWKLLLYFIAWGVPINFAVWQIFGFRFDFLTPFAWGIAYYLVYDQFPKFFRNCVMPKHLR